jgi:hypothetical protein
MSFNTGAMASFVIDVSHTEARGTGSFIHGILRLHLTGSASIPLHVPIHCYATDLSPDSAHKAKGIRSMPVMRVYLQLFRDKGPALPHSRTIQFMIVSGSQN